MKMDRLLQAMARWFQKSKRTKRKQRSMKSKSSSSSIESCSSSRMSSTSSSSFSSNSAKGIETLLQISLSPINPLEQHTSFKIYDDGDCFWSSPEVDDGLYQTIATTTWTLDVHCWYEIKRIIDIAQLELNIKTLFHVTLQLNLWIALHETEQSGHYGKWRFLHSPIPCLDIPEKCHFLLYLQFWCCCFNLLCKLENCVLWAYIMSCLLQNLSFWSHNVKIRDSFVFSKYLQIWVFYFYFLLFVCLK